MIGLTDFDPVSTREDWVDTLQLIDADTDGPADFTGYSFTLEARRLTPNGVSEPVVSGASGAELTFPDGPAGGVMELTFRTPFATACGGRYRVTITAVNGADTLQFLSHITVQNLTEAPA